jgi:hypothetical protein
MVGDEEVLRWLGEGKGEALLEVVRRGTIYGGFTGGFTRTRAVNSYAQN